MEFDLGKFVMTPRGGYNSATTYSKLDLVHYQSKTWISKVDNNTNHTPSTSSNYWGLVCEGITGAQGAQGAAGTNGVDGVNGANGVDGAQGTQGVQGPAGTNPSIPNIYWKIKGYFHKADAGDLVVDKMGGGELHVYTGVKSLKLTNVQKGEGTSIGNSGRVYDGWIPTYMFIGVQSDFILHQSDMKDSTGTTTFILCSQPEGKFLGGHNYLLTFFQNYIEVEEMYSLPA